MYPNVFDVFGAFQFAYADQYTLVPFTPMTGHDKAIIDPQLIATLLKLPCTGGTGQENVARVAAILNMDIV